MAPMRPTQPPPAYYLISVPVTSPYPHPAGAAHPAPAPAGGWYQQPQQPQHPRPPLTGSSSQPPPQQHATSQARLNVTSAEQQQYDEAIKESYLAEVQRQRAQSVGALRTGSSSQVGNASRGSTAEMLSKKYWKEGR